MKPLRFFWRITKWTGLAFLLAVLILSGVYLYPVLSDPEPGFLARKGKISNIQATREWQQFGDRFQELTLTSDTGLQVEVSIRRSAHHSTPRPLVIILGGYGTGRHATELITTPQDVVIASLSYPYAGDRRMSGIGLLENIPHIQQAMLDITPAILLTLDYLLEQNYVDDRRVELAGVSLGAFFVAIPGALDKRIRRVWFVQGAGDPQSIFAYRLQKRIDSPWMRDQVAALIALVGNVHYLTPEHWVGRIAPRQVVAINSRQDTSFPAASVKALHDALQAPREIIWLEGEHVMPSRQNVVKQLTDLVLSRVKEEIR